MSGSCDLCHQPGPLERVPGYLLWLCRDCQVERGPRGLAPERVGWLRSLFDRFFRGWRPRRRVAWIGPDHWRYPARPAEPNNILFDSCEEPKQ